ncbi:MAG: hypothetical protein WAK78_11285 [Candidatus Acidiferrales bacterium]
MGVILWFAMADSSLGVIEALVTLSHWLTEGKQGLDGGAKLQKLLGLLECVFLVSGRAGIGGFSCQRIACTNREWVDFSDGWYELSSHAGLSCRTE